MNKRLAIFVLLGPLLVWLTVLLHLFLPDLLRRPDGATVFFFGVVLVVVAVVGFVPALVLAGVDHLMVERGLSGAMRAAACAVLAYPLTILGFWIVLGKLGLLSGLATELPVAGLYGMIPAAVCSWLAGWGSGAST
jgi:hypothetical protein